MRGRSRAVLGLIAVLVFDVWLRGHTVGPTLREKFGVDLYPVTGASSEPLDCDEAVYAYIGQRLARGAVMYRDLTENKPPGGYWLYALTVALGGSTELTVRLMPIPFVLATIALVWWLALRLRGPAAAVLAALSYAVVSTDPFLFGNGANMEHMLNLFATAALALMVSARDRPGRGRLLAAGACLGAAVLVKQVAVVHAPVFALVLLFRRTIDDAIPRPLAARLKDITALLAGLAAVCGLAAVVLIEQGAGRDAFDDVFRYGPALATDLPADPHAPPFLVRWITGNADPSGKLPWPFGATDYLVWWGTGSWPFWLAGLPSVAWLLLKRQSTAARRLVAAWTLSAWLQVALPRLFWQHYYLLPLPGLAVVVAVFFMDLVASVRSGGSRGVLSATAALFVAIALLWTAKLQAVEYLGVAPTELTIRDKGGRQWVALRDLGRDLARRSTVWPHPTLYVWGWQSPLFFYSRLDGVTRQLFADDLIKSYAGKDHPLIAPRVARTLRELEANPPSLIFTGYPPYPALRAFLDARYLPSNLVPLSPDGRGLWVERSKYGEFETFRDTR
jgi:4-amino-4-deoxy-L-arabinose transferase-like glycosyltransferase